MTKANRYQTQRNEFIEKMNKVINFLQDVTFTSIDDKMQANAMIDRANRCIDVARLDVLAAERHWNQINS